MTNKKPITMSDAGKIGGIASAAKLTPLQRTERARKAVKARWDRVKKTKA